MYLHFLEIQDLFTLAMINNMKLLFFLLVTNTIFFSCFQNTEKKIKNKSEYKDSISTDIKPKKTNVFKLRKNKKNNVLDTNTYYQDFDIFDFKPIKPIKKYATRGFLKIDTLTSSKIVITTHWFIENDNYEGEREVISPDTFHRKNDYWYREMRLQSGAPKDSALLYYYFKKDYFLEFIISKRANGNYDKNKKKIITSYTYNTHTIRRIKKSRPNKIEICSYNKYLPPNSNLDFDGFLKSHQSHGYSYLIYNNMNNFMECEHYSRNLEDGEVNIEVSKNYGFPTNEYSVYWLGFKDFEAEDIEEYRPNKRFD
ncbi:MAG: hypothetical protein EAZ20_13500, partial [Bacteroidetes bacterium]